MNVSPLWATRATPKQRNIISFLTRMDESREGIEGKGETEREMLKDQEELFKGSQEKP
jgi:hypothetical protein